MDHTLLSLLRQPAVLMFSLNDVNFRPTGRASTASVLADTVVCEWWVEMDSNHRPYAYQAYALTT